MKKERNIVIIYAKWPELENAKTRIRKETDGAFALEFSKACLDDLVSHLDYSHYYDLIVGADTKKELDLFKENYGLDGILTEASAEYEGTDKQSRKIEDVFHALLKDYGKAILIPMDVPFLSKEDLLMSFEKLDEYEYVLGPEFNGGVYLIGMGVMSNKNVFGNVHWSTTQSFSELLKNCDKQKTYALPFSSDINTIQELLKERNRIARGCPHIDSLLKRHGYDFSNQNRFVDFDELNISIPVVSAIIEKKGKNGKEILIQTRYKPTTDPKNTGKIEIPNGLIEKYEPAYIAVEREVKQETGLQVKIADDFIKRTELTAPIEVTYVPFSCTQQLSNGRSYLGINFICEVIGGKLSENKYETRKPHWVNLDGLSSLIKNHPERIFPFNLPTLKQYLDYQGCSQ